MSPASTILPGCRFFPEALDKRGQEAVLADIRQLVAVAPLYRPTTSRGQQMSVRMTAAGRFGWVSDRHGYRYETRHPVTGHAWPQIPASVMELWHRFAGASVRDPECCLINFYGEGARMGLHQDKDEADFTQPVVSLSLGDDGLFRVGGVVRKSPTKSVWLKSGNVVVLADEARLAFHGVDRIRFGTSSLLSQGGRVNITLRVVT